MATQELKFRVDSFDQLTPKLKELGAPLVKESESSHYYCPLAGNDVLKLVAKPSRLEIHELKEREGRFELVRNEPVSSLADGLRKFEALGYSQVGLVHMHHVDYRYGDGVIGLYTINGSLRSVILDFPTGQHALLVKRLGLDTAERIIVPYNKYLEQRGELELQNIAALMG